MSLDAMPTTIVRERRRQRDGLYGALVLVPLAGPASAIARGGPHDTGDIVVIVILVLVTAAMAAVWAYMLRHPRSIEVGRDRIVLRRSGVESDEGEITRTTGSHPLIVSSGNYRIRHWALTTPARIPLLPLSFFRLDQVIAACAEHGWSVER
jgi:hypothetical protein